MTKCEIIIEKVSMRELLGYYGFKQVRGKYICPFHEDKHPSAILYEKTNTFHCFVDDITYNVINFVCAYEHCTKSTAIKHLDAIFKLGLTENLSEQQIAEIEHKKRLKQREKERKLLRERKERIALAIIKREIDLFESLERATHPRKIDILENTWNCDRLFFLSLKRQQWLNFLYDRISGIDHPTCEYDYRYDNLTNEQLVEKVIECL